MTAADALIIAPIVDRAAVIGGSLIIVAVCGLFLLLVLGR